MDRQWEGKEVEGESSFTKEKEESKCVRETSKELLVGKDGTPLSGCHRSRRKKKLSRDDTKFDKK